MKGCPLRVCQASLVGSGQRQKALCMPQDSDGAALQTAAGDQGIIFVLESASLETGKVGKVGRLSQSFEAAVLE